MSTENCPCCPNHCPKDNLGCGRGREYFSNLNNEQKPIEQDSISSKIIMDLKRCGHMLHHNHDIKPEEILANLSNEELNKLHELLSKISL